MSSDLQWAIIRKNNSFLHKNRVGKQAFFSREANNLTNKHSFRSNGLVNTKTVGVTAAAKGVVLTVRKVTGKNKPKNAFQSTPITRGGRRAAKTIKARLDGSNYRKDLSKEAVARACAIIESQKPKKEKVRRGRKTNNASA